MARMYSLKDDVTGEVIPAGNEMQISATQGKDVYTLDIDKDSELGLKFLAEGVKSKRRGRPGKIEETPEETPVEAVTETVAPAPVKRRRNRKPRNTGVGSTASGSVAGKVNR